MFLYTRNISCRSIFDDSCNFFFTDESSNPSQTSGQREQSGYVHVTCVVRMLENLFENKKKNIFFCMSVILFAFKNFYKYTCYILKPQWTTSIKTGRRRMKNLNVLGITSPLAIRKIHISFPIAKIENAS